MTHATFATLDNERYLLKVPGRRNRDYSIWDLKGGGRFYTVFPYFHLAGFLSLLINPIFTEASSPVLGPPLMPPSGSLLKEVMRHQKLRALYLPPSIAEQLLMEPGGLDFFKELDFLCYTGGPFSPSAGEKLTAVTELVPLYGSTETFQVPQLAPSSEDWAWMEWNPHFKVDMQRSDDEEDAFELVMFANESTRRISALNHNLPGVSEYRTKDLFKPHPTKPGLWRYYGRRDDIIVLSNGEKFNPVPAELEIQGHPMLLGALIIGQGRTHATLLVEPKAGAAEKGNEDIIDSIWPLVEKANRLLPAQGRILRSNLLISVLNKPVTRAGKGTIVRKLTEQLYKSEIDALYDSFFEKPARQIIQLESSTDQRFETESVLNFIRNNLSDLFPELQSLDNDDDFFSAGLDSVMITQLISNMKAGLQESSTHTDFSWLDTRILYRHPTIEKLSDVLCSFLNTGVHPDHTSGKSRVAAMNELVEKYTQQLQDSTVPIAEQETNAPRSIVLLGSTGYLGPQILTALLANPDIKSIYCLDRSANARARNEKAIRNAGAYTDTLFARVHFLRADLQRPQFGLSEDDHRKIAQRTDTIIYNSWKPDFSIPLSSFEKPFFTGLRTAIDWSRTTPKRPRIVFVSSLAAVGNWSRVYTTEPMIPETPIGDPNVALHMGYGESKCVAERILQVAHDQCSVPVDIVRTGQIGGPTPPSKVQWPVQGWLLALIKTSKALGALPTHVAPVDWIQADALARQISEVVGASASGSSGMYRVFNLVHSKVEPWDLFLDTLKNWFDIQAERCGLPQWIDILDKKVREDPEGEYVALKFSDFLRSIDEGMDHMRCVSENLNKLPGGAMEPLTEDLLAKWIGDWEF